MDDRLQGDQNLLKLKNKFRQTQYPHGNIEISLISREYIRLSLRGFPGLNFKDLTTKSVVTDDGWPEQLMAAAAAASAASQISFIQPCLSLSVKL